VGSNHLTKIEELEIVVKPIFCMRMYETIMVYTFSTVNIIYGTKFDSQIQIYIVLYTMLSEINYNKSIQIQLSCKIIGYELIYI